MAARGPEIRVYQTTAKGFVRSYSVSENSEKNSLFSTVSFLSLCDRDDGVTPLPCNHEKGVEVPSFPLSLSPPPCPFPLSRSLFLPPCVPA